MAEAALMLAVGKLSDLLIKKADFLIGVEDKLQEVKRELQWMQSFLKDASEKQVESERIRMWISDVRELALDAEDVIDSFTLKVDAPRKSRGLVDRCVCLPQDVYRLDKLGQEIDLILRRLEEINQRRGTYGIIGLLDGETAAAAGPSSSGRTDGVEWRRRVSYWQPDKHVVGVEADVKKLLEKAVFVEKKGLLMASIVGMGGVGKSTLAKKVYNGADVVVQFECRAWVTVSRHFSPKELMKEVLLQLPGLGRDKLSRMKEASEETLKRMTYECLQGKRYFMVLDDVWRQEHWEYLKSAFPDEQDKASRLLITSRDNNILGGAAHYSHKLKGLDYEQSRELFLKAASIDTIEGKCLPPELEEIGNQILKKCDGLPLAITVMGGLLLEQGLSVSGWKKVFSGIKSHLAAGKDSVSAILELSYQDLPPQIKSCFFCLSLFKEDALISRRRLVRIWIAQGFIPHEEGEKSMEEIAWDYLDELTNRNMVQALQFHPCNNAPSYCQVHDLLHDLSIRKAKEEINFDILSEERTSESLVKARHLVIHCNKRFMMLSRSSNRHIRSLFFHGAKVTDDVAVLCSYHKSFDGLRVMELERFGLKEVPKFILRLISLRYLGLGNNNIEKLPRSLSRLKYLQTLNIVGNWGLEVPNVLWKLKNLRHLHMPYDIICEEPLRLDTLQDLQTLSCVSTKNIIIEDLAKLASLCRLDVVVPGEEGDLNKLFTSIRQICTLNVVECNFQKFASMDSIASLQHLTELHIHGPIETLPHNFPQNLSRLCLGRTKLKEDPAPLLERLPKLLFLDLLMNSYIGEEMVIKQNGFPRLKVLQVFRTNELRKIHIGNEALPELKVLLIRDCPVLKILPEVEELRMMSTLHQLEIVGTSNETAWELKGDKYAHIISNIPSVKITT